jgi:hypothetical protein
VADLCEHGNEPWGSTNGGEFLDQLSDYQLLKKDSAQWRWLFKIHHSFIRTFIFICSF